MPKKQTPKKEHKAVAPKMKQQGTNKKDPGRPPAAIKASAKEPKPARAGTLPPDRKTTLREKKFQDIKKKLLAQKKSLLEGALEALNELPGPTVFPDLGDQATAEMDRNFMLRLRGRERKLLKKIDEAIERIDQHVFGICDRCGDEINIRRLEARPVTTMCIDCKTIEEEEEKLREA